MSIRTRMIRFVRHWHARAGVIAALFLLFLAISGLVLNHTDALSLAKREVKASWLMHWYGLKSTVPKQGYLFKDGFLAAADGRWVMDGHILREGAEQPPLGAMTWNQARVIAGAEALYLYTAEGQLIDKLSDAELPGKPIRQLGLAGDKLVLATVRGHFSSSDALTWQPHDGEQPTWSSLQALPNAELKEVKQAFAPSLPLERIILDLHSGRIFGRYGPLLMDLAAIVLVVLSLSGVWIYLRTVRKKPQH
ncbi:MAG TPA: PepSY-associated TM helix domain-containing protein [Methylotenera sp.]|nr:PepSY-associated TM helix domain-containing protein [Methylotenera sp.]HPV43907.1 PepSY-associated TM helix domain-containing protein [Methylotenera sp.]